MRLHTHPFSIVPRRVRIALREKALAYEEVEVNVLTAEHRGAEFRRLNPFAQIPVLEDGALVLCESVALERRLTGRDWLIDDYSLADICYAPLVTVFDRVGLGGLVEAHPAVAAWVRRLDERPAVRDTAPPMMRPSLPPRR